MSDTDKSLYSLRYNQVTSNLEAFGGGSPQWTQIVLNNVDPQQVPITRLINTTAPLQGGGNLSADRTLSIPQANGTTDGYLSAIDWLFFTAKLTSTLNSANIFIGDGSNVAVGTPLSGDASLANTGVLTFNTVNGNVGTFMNAQITVNAKGLITAASSGTIGSLTDVGTDGITITGGTNAVLGTGTSIDQHVADSAHNGYLSSTDWSTFNAKQPADNYITALTGDVTATGPGSVAATLATVNGNVGSFTYASITVNAKGLVTAASSGTAPVTSVSGTAGNISSTGGTTPVIDLVNTAVTPATYTNTTLTVDANGRLTAASSGTAPVTSVSGTTNQITSTGGTTPVIAIANPVTLPGALTAGGAFTMAGNNITGGGTIAATNINAGVSGTAGTVSIFPTTSTTGKTTLTASSNSGDTTTTINTAAQAAARTYTVPDAGASASFVMTQGTQTISGAKTFDGQLIGKGTATNDSAAAGFIGEYIEAIAGSTNFPTTDTYGDLTSISLTAGDWDVSLVSGSLANGATVTTTIFGISTTSGNSGTGLTFGTNQVNNAGPTAASGTSSAIPVYRMSLSGTTTVYYKYQASFSVATPKAQGRISARRSR